MIYGVNNMEAIEWLKTIKQAAPGFVFNCSC
jgi:hypothetical protein